MDLLERESYLTELRRLQGDITGGHGRLLLLGGEAGVGKTSLVDTFCQHMDGEIAQIRSSCDALSTPSPLSVVRAYAAALNVRFDLDAHEQRQCGELFHALLTAIGRHDQPLLMVLEDAHWADEASLDFVRFVGRRMSDLPLLWIVTYRDDEIGMYHPLQRILGDLATTSELRRMTLAPLSEVAVRSLAQASSVDSVELFRSTGGNPFYVTEVLAAGNTAIPVSVSDAVLARASRLSPSARDVLKVAAVIGARVDPELLLNVAGPVLNEIEECVDSGLLRVDGNELGFRHQIARDSIYATVIPPRRVLLHGRILAVLRNQPDRERHLARLAHHAELAGDREQTFELALAAAQQAVELRAHREAAAQYARAIRFADTLAPGDRAKLLECWSYECYVTDQIVDAITGRRQALEIWQEAGEQVRVGDNLRWLSRLYWFTGRNQEAEKAAAAALAQLEPLPPGSELAWAYSNMSLLRMLADDADAAIHWGGRAIELAERLGDQEILSHALNNVGAARFSVNDERGRAELERSLAIALEAGLEDHVARAYVNLASGSVRKLDLASGERYLADGIAYTTRHDLDPWRIYMTGWRALLHLHRGAWEDAESDCAIILPQPRASTAVNRIGGLTVLGRLRTRRGDPDAMVPLDEALALALQTGEAQRLGPVHCARAEAAWFAGDRERIRSEAAAAIALLANTGDRWLLSEAVYWRWLSGEPVTMHDDLTEPYALEVRGDASAAATAWDALVYPYEAARARLRSDVEDDLRDALATFDRLGAEPAATMATRRLREIGARGPRSTTRSHPAGLTSREAEILKLIVSGHTNRHIADRLYLSPKTVEHHVSAILGKLGVPTRQQAVRVATEMNLPESSRN